MMAWFESMDEDYIRRERAKARELRKQGWWKSKIGQGVCHYCGKQFSPKDLTLDHVVPLVRGGRSTKGNCVPCCKECNSRKQDMLPIEWEEYLEKLKNS
jgi:5-methylcytosine-specific restriction endonuclease McrA